MKSAYQAPESKSSPFSQSPPNLKTDFDEKVLSRSTVSMDSFKRSSLDENSGNRTIQLDPQISGRYTNVSESERGLLYDSTPAPRLLEPQIVRASFSSREKIKQGVALQVPTPIRKADSLLTFEDLNVSEKDFYSHIRSNPVQPIQIGSSFSAQSSIYESSTPTRRTSTDVSALIGTPNQMAAKASIFRLNKLGSEIDVLQSRLDEIDGKRKSKVISRVIHH
jgi:hypothetical protein